MKISLKCAVGFCLLILNSAILCMQAPAGNDAAQAITGPLDTYQAKWQEWKRRSNRLEDLKKAKALPFKIGALAGGTVVTAAAARWILKRSDSKFKAVLALGSLAMGAIASWFGFIKILGRVVKCFPSVIQARSEKHYFERALIEWVWKTDVPDKTKIQLGEFFNDHNENFTQDFGWNIWAHGNGLPREHLESIPKHSHF